MKPAMLKQTSILIVNQKAEFKTGGQVIVFPGYMKAYIESNSEGNNEKVIPDLKENDKLICDNLKTEIHKTKPPARFTEASLIKSLEQNDRTSIDLCIYNCDDSKQKICRENPQNFPLLF